MVWFSAGRSCIGTHRVGQPAGARPSWAGPSWAGPRGYVRVGAGLRPLTVMFAASAVAPSPRVWWPPPWRRALVSGRRRGRVLTPRSRRWPPGSACAAGSVFHPDGNLPGAHEAEAHSLSVEKICHSESRHGCVRGLVFSRSQEVEEGTAEMNCRASRSSRMRNGSGVAGPELVGPFTGCRAERPQGPHAVPAISSSTTERGKELTPSGSPGRGRTPLGYRRPRIGRWSPVTHSRSPLLRPPRRTSGTREPAQSAGRWC